MKRLVAAPLWFLVGWYIGAAAAWILGLTVNLGPFLAVAAAAIVVADPMAIVWSRTERARSHIA